MKIEVLLALLSIGAFFCVGSGNPIQVKSARALIYIGEINGHQFFQADDTMTANFDEAKTRCSTQGMRLARIASDAEMAYLRPILPIQNNYYWTAAKSNITTFSWDDGSNVIPTVSPVTPSCLFLSSDLSFLYIRGCIAGAYVLCDNAFGI